MQFNSYKRYSAEFKQEALKLAGDDGMTDTVKLIFLR